MAGKGSKRREENTNQVNDNWDKINWDTSDNVEEPETTCITIETTGNVGSDIYEPEYNLCVTASNVGNVGPGTTEPRYKVFVADSCKI